MERELPHPQTLPHRRAFCVFGRGAALDAPDEIKFFQNLMLYKKLLQREKDIRVYRGSVYILYRVFSVVSPNR